MLVVVSVEEELWEKHIENLAVIYRTSWGEVYVRRFYTERRFKEFVMKSGAREGRVVVDYYLQKKCNDYATLLARTKAWVKG